MNCVNDLILRILCSLYTYAFSDMIDVGRQLTLDINEDIVYSMFSTNNSMEVYTHTFFT